MEKQNLLYEGKAKRVYLTADSRMVIVEYKDDATAFDGKKRGIIKDKGIINNRLTNHIMQKLSSSGIATHFVKQLSLRETLVKKVQIIPIEVIVRNVAAGSLCKRLGLEEGGKLITPILEFCYKNDELGDPFINDYHILALELATDNEVSKIKEMAFKINDLLKLFFGEFDIELVDFKLEFGRYNDEVLLADEISPDTCRLWDSKTQMKLDKDRFRRDLGGVENAYLEVHRRILGDFDSFES